MPATKITANSICIIGAGRVGGAFALALAAKGWRVVLVSRRPAAHAELGDSAKPIFISRVPVVAGLYLLAVPDQLLAGCARELAGQLRDLPKSGTLPIFLHTSGSQPVAALDVLKSRGAIGALHPFCPIADAKSGAAALPFETLTFQGGHAAHAGARRIARALGSPLHWLPATTNRLTYHAAAVLASNLPYALFLQAEELLTPALRSRKAARALLAPLIATAVQNYLNLGPAGLTGPARRGDKKLIAAETAALKGPARAAYKLLSAYLLKEAGQIKSL